MSLIYRHVLLLYQEDCGILGVRSNGELGFWAFGSRAISSFLFTEEFAKLWRWNELPRDDVLSSFLIVEYLRIFKENNFKFKFSEKSTWQNQIRICAVACAQWRWHRQTSLKFHLDATGTTLLESTQDAGTPSRRSIAKLDNVKRVFWIIIYLRGTTKNSYLEGEEAAVTWEYFAGASKSCTRKLSGELIDAL